ncbi:hypothetical protein G6F32_016573 [Rhizopus arrhizus]|nr:hypothetical protein G6F32_016573 [Rhizopus arrhizus]
MERSASAKPASRSRSRCRKPSSRWAPTRWLRRAPDAKAIPRCRQSATAKAAARWAMRTQARPPSRSLEIHTPGCGHRPWASLPTNSSNPASA